MTLHDRRAALLGIAAAACYAFNGAGVSARPYPSQTIRFIIPAGAGGLPDTVARIVAKRLQEQASASRWWSRTRPAATAPCRSAR